MDLGVVTVAKFVKLHQDGRLYLVNLDKVLTIIDLDDGTAMLQFADADMGVDERFEDVVKTVGAAQGGIPMDPSKMY